MNFGIENETVEFKKSTSELKEAMESVCAMLNKHGFGTVYFGILPNGEVCGQVVNESTLRDVSRKVYESISPQIIPTISKKVVDNKDIIELSFKGYDRPYTNKGTFYIRSADEDRILPLNELRQMFEYNKKDSWDEMLSDYSLDDVDLDTLDKFFKKATACGRIKDKSYNPEKLLIKLNLLKQGKLTNAGYYLFSKNKPITLNMAVFATDEKLTFLDINRVEGNIFDLIEEAYDYVKKNIRWKADIVGLQRIETPEIPLRSLREIICNSFAHARYHSNTLHEITIHPGLIRIYNPGEFPIGYKPEDFVNEDLPSMVRNPMILKILFLSDDVESYSSGFKRVYDECKKNNVPVDYIIAQEGFTFIFRRFDINKSQKRVLSDEEKRIIELLKENPYMSAESLSDMFNKSPRSIQRILASLKADGFIERVGYTKGYWIVY
ncbi:MAG: putative DNA binding domain-containing protein [Clostridiales bacterium]|nr:putative DNA binding domain-containing protein [Clostridiales bacterium]